MPIQMMTATNELNEDMLIEAEHLRNDTANLLNSLSIPGPLIGQLVAESMLGFLFIWHCIAAQKIIVSFYLKLCKTRPFWHVCNVPEGHSHIFLMAAS